MLIETKEWGWREEVERPTELGFEFNFVAYPKLDWIGLVWTVHEDVLAKR